MTGITGLLELKATADADREKHIKEREEQKRIAGQEKNKLRDQMRGIESQIRLLETRTTNTEIATIEYIKKIEQPLFDQREHMIRDIALSNLKHRLPDKFEKPVDQFHRSPEDEDVLFDSPIAQIVARYTNSGNRVNTIDYTIKLCTHKDIRIDQFDPIFKDGNYSSGKFVFSKAFKTIEDARNYNIRNKEKQIKEVVGHINSLIGEINKASDNFESVFDFRLFWGSEVSRYHSGDRTYKIERMTKNTMELTEKLNWNGEKRDVKILVWNKGFGFEITGGDEKDREQILGFLAKTFNLQYHSITE